MDYYEKGDTQASSVDFFKYQDQARRGTFRLSLLFILGVILTVASVNLLILGLFGINEDVPTHGVDLLKSVAPTILWTTSVTLLVIGIMALYRIFSLNSGGGKVALELGGVLVPEDVREFALRRYRNVVEEVALASSVPVPEIYILEHEQGINAFAAGNKPDNAAICVTRGALDRLNREELQAVIAHEFSHIANGDMRLNLRLVGVIFGIMGLGIIAGWTLRGAFRGRGGKNAIVIVVLGLALMIIGLVGVFFGNLIKAGINRQREYLADASAVQFTRQSRGLEGALMKIAGIPEGARLTDHIDKAKEFDHMLFGKGVTSIFSTHPSIIKRIQRLNPSFDKEILNKMKDQWSIQPPNGYLEDIALGFATEAPDSCMETRGNFDMK